MKSQIYKQQVVCPAVGHKPGKAKAVDIKKQKIITLHGGFHLKSISLLPQLETEEVSAKDAE